MRAIDIIQSELANRMCFMHTSRWNAVWRTVLAVIQCRQLWLTALGRALPGDVKRKHAIKAVDRLLGNEHLHQERLAIGTAIAAMLLRKGAKPLVLIDTFEIRHKVVGLTASFAHRGRSFPIHSTVGTKIRPNIKECRLFLNDLREILPKNCRPVLITDGGFETQWFEEIEKLGWDYVGRVRGQTKFSYKGEWVTRLDLHKLAKRRAKNLGLVAFPRKRPSSWRLVLSKLPKSGHRQVKTRTGPSRDGNYIHYRKNAIEPLLLATSLSSKPQIIVGLYKTRMQIEQTFRDIKSHRSGWSFRHCGSRATERVEILLLIASLALVVQQLIGLAGEMRGLHLRHQANTVKNRRVLSIFVLGGILINRGDARELSSTAIQLARRKLRSEIDTLVLHDP